MTHCQMDVLVLQAWIDMARHENALILSLHARVPAALGARFCVTFVRYVTERIWWLADP